VLSKFVVCLLLKKGNELGLYFQLHRYVSMPCTNCLLMDFECKVQRALKLWATGTITLQKVLDAKAIKGTTKGLAGLPKVMTGIEESCSFNDVTWGAVTRRHMEFVNHKLRQSSFEKIVQKAKEFMVTNNAGGSRRTSDTMDVDGASVQLVDLSDSDSECKQNWTSLCVQYLTFSTEKARHGPVMVSQQIHVPVIPLPQCFAAVLSTSIMSSLASTLLSFLFLASYIEPQFNLGEHHTKFNLNPTFLSSELNFIHFVSCHFFLPTPFLALPSFSPSQCSC
jgi:hypothetical protein